MYGNLEREVEVAVNQIRARLAAANVGSFTLIIHASGRTSSGDAKISYSLGDQYSSERPTGAWLAPTVDEYLRRKGWTEANTPLVIGHETITFSPSPAVSEPISDLPF